MSKKLKSNGFVGAVVLGTVICIAVSITGSLILSWLLETEKIEMNATKYGIMGITAVSSVLGSFAAKSRLKEKTLLLCGATALAYYLILICSGALLFEGEMLGILETMLLVLGPGVAVAFVGSNRNTKNHSRVYRMKNG